MSSDEESVNDVASDIEIIETGGHDEEQTEEVQRDNAEENEADGQTDGGDKKVVKPKRIIKNPQPKLNEETLKGSRGLAAIESYFERVKFKGKGYEDQDLKVIMKTYEYWCHRLFPKFPFDTCIERLEKLGTKKATQTHIKRIRYNLLIEDKPIVDDSDEENNVEGFVDIQQDQVDQQLNSQFDQLLPQPPPPPPAITTTELTEDQLERIRINKERAEKLRQGRLKRIREKAGLNLELSSQLPGVSGLQSETPQNDYLDEDEFSGSIEEQDPDIFNHESNIKGKHNVRGTTLKKKSRKNDESDTNRIESKHTNGNNVDCLPKSIDAVESSQKMDAVNQEILDRPDSIEANIFVNVNEDTSDDYQDVCSEVTVMIKDVSSNRDGGDSDQDSRESDFGFKKAKKRVGALDSDEEL